MADSSAIRAGRAFVEIFSDDSKLRQDLKKTETFFKSWGRTMSAIGYGLLGSATAIVAPFLVMAKSAAGAGADLVAMSQRTGVAVEQLTELQYVAQQNRVDVDTLETSLKRMSRTIADAGEKGGESAEALAMLGLNASNLLRMKTADQFLTIGNALAKVANEAQRVQLSMAIMGRGGTATLPIFAGGPERIRELIKHFDDLGLVVSGKDAVGLRDLNRQFQDVWLVVQRLGMAITVGLAPVLTHLIPVVEKGLAGFRASYVQYAGLIPVVLSLATGAGALAVAMLGIGYAQRVAVLGFGAVNLGLKTVGIGLNLISAIIGASFTSLPVFLAVAAAALGVYVITSGNAAKSIGGAWKSTWDAAAHDATTSLNGIQAALQSGKWKLAAQIMWTTIKLEFLRGMQAIEDTWDVFSKELWNKITHIGLEGPPAPPQAPAGNPYDKYSPEWLKWENSHKLDGPGIPGKHDFTPDELGGGTAPAIWPKYENTGMGPEWPQRHLLPGPHAQISDAETAKLEELGKHNMASIEAMKEYNAYVDSLIAKYHLVFNPPSHPATRPAGNGAIDAQQKALQQQANQALHGFQDQINKTQDELDKLKNSAGEASDALVGSSKSMGTFNPSAIWGIAGGGDPFARRTANATEAMRQILWDLTHSPRYADRPHLHVQY